ncbi:hypothetical protein Y032_0025g1282 [Ancylostoma ceylanicum]|uniref:BMERB domain-containing protein n=1 Tax=Ancylostoma ceylanicum TaxID=53326 RepID=A0A016UW87_9BILA|nr:hypothetical protein Y032_0025g1282 [Ancylostoma ceylanicum]
MSNDFFDNRPKLCKATVTYHSELQFQDRLSYIDKRYDHLRKLTQTLKKKINDLEDIMRQDNDDENMEQIRQLIEEIKREKQLMRDEAHIIRGELSQAMYNEDLRTAYLVLLKAENSYIICPTMELRQFLFSEPVPADFVNFDLFVFPLS